MLNNMKMMFELKVYLINIFKTYQSLHKHQHESQGRELRLPSTLLICRLIKQFNEQMHFA